MEEVQSTHHRLALISARNVFLMATWVRCAKEMVHLSPLRALLYIQQVYV